MTNKWEIKLGDLVKFGTLDDVSKALESCSESFLAVCHWIIRNRERSDTNLALYNLLRGAMPFVQLARQFLCGPIQILAFCTRNIFEINLRACYVLQSDANLQQWMAECVIDSIQVLEGILLFSDTAASQDIAVLRAEIERIRSISRRYNINDSAKLLGVADLAKAVGREKEYRALFKLYSKLVHPSSYLLNGLAENTYGAAIRQILVINIQLYANELLERIRQRLKVPDEMIGSHMKMNQGA